MIRSLLPAILAVALLPAGARAAGLTLLHAGTVYADAKGAPLKAPEGVTCADGGRFVVADTGNARLLTYTAREGSLGGGAEIKLPELQFPLRLQLDSKGNLLALDGKSHRVVRVDANGAFGGFVKVQGAGASETMRIGAFKVGPSDELVLLDLGGARVLVADAAGAVTRQVPLPKGKGMVTDVALDASGTLYALDPIGATLWSAEKGAAELKPLASGLAERMSFGTYLTFAKGKILVVDQNGSGVVVLGPDGSFLGRQLAIGWSDGLVNYPGQLCVNGEGIAFLADRFNNRVQLFTVGE